MIRHCPHCKPHAFQDAKYGPKMRVMNPLPKQKEQPQRWRCTVCGDPKKK